MLEILSDPILSIVYPQQCGVCSGEVECSRDGTACTSCWNATTIFSGNETLCNKCGAFLFGANASGSASCRKCEDQSYDRAYAVGLYERALAVSILQLKTSPRIFGRLERLLIEAAAKIRFENSPIIVPIPLSSRRLQERGFNQAAVIGRVIAKPLGFSLDESSLIRKIHTPMHRAGMDRKARGVTVKDAFEVVRPKFVKGRDILLVDDIFTSGETASSGAKVLKKSGALTVNVLTIARAA